MRHTLILLLLLSSVSGVRAHCCRGGYSVGFCAPAYFSPPAYVVPYWFPPMVYEPVWVSPAVVPAPAVIPKAALRESTTPPKATPAEGGYPRIGNPRLPTEDVEPSKVLPAPKKVPPAKTDDPRPAGKEKVKEVSIDQFLIPAEKTRAEALPEVKVGIFNHSDREMDLEINGETVKLPADQYVSLRLPRAFTWAVRGQAPREVKVPADADGMEIVFRR